MEQQTFQWMMGLGLAGLGAMMLYLHSQLTARIDGVEKNLTSRMDKLDSRMDKLDEKLTDIDRRLCRMEGAMSTCCALNHEQHKRAE
jgi:hypothetical protein